MIVGEEKPDAGTLDGRRHRAAGLRRPVPRRRSAADATVFEEITGGADRIVVGGRELHGRAYVAGFGFKGSDQQKKVGQLSGGERNRVQLAKVLNERRQRAAARRADQRPRRRHAARPGGRAARLPRLRGGHQPRPLVPRPHRHPRARLRGRLARSAGGRGTSATTRPTGTSALGVDADQPHRIRYKPLVRG